MLTVLPLSLGLVACGDDDEDFEAYCEDTLAIETIAEPDIDFEALSEEELAEESKKFASEELKPLADDIRDEAPEEIADDIDVLADAVDEIAETGNFEVFESEEVEAASDRTHAFDLANCGWEQSNVTAREYAFDGLEGSYEEGPRSFEFFNDGKELHELALLRKKDDTTESFDQLLELDQAEAEKKVDSIGHAFGAPGEDEYFVTDLKRGEYLAICFVPVGTTPEAAEAAEETGEEPGGPPHFTQGMKFEFTVE